MCNHEIVVSVFADDMHIEGASLIVDHESGKTVDESTTYPIIDNGVVPLLSDVSSSEDEDETSGCPVNATKPEVTTNPFGVVPLLVDTTSSEDEDKRSECFFSATEPEATKSPVSNVSAVTSQDSDTLLNESDEETEIELDEESATDNDDETLRETVLREQTLRTWLNLVEVAEDEEMDEFTRCMAAIVADIVEWWRQHTRDVNPFSYHVDFGTGSPIDLIMILALLPERLQRLISIEDSRRSPTSNGENMSWLHEQTTDILVQLSINPNPLSTHFGHDLATMVRNSVDEAWQEFTSGSYLEDQIHLQSLNELEPEQYRFPPSTSKIVFLFNPTEIHWTVVETSIAESAWTYTLYDSLSQRSKGPTWKACHAQLPLLERLICRASGFASPATREIIMANSAQQENVHDCGPIAVYNAIELLEGREPCTEIDPEELRLKFLRLIRDALYVLDLGLETPVFRAYMREVCLDYIP